MSKYLIQAEYAGDGVKGLLKEGGSSRRAAVEKAIKSVGGTWESCYFACNGQFDIMGIAEVPDNITMASLTLTVRAPGSLSRMNVTALITPEEMDQAVQKSPTYRGPGQ